MSHAEHFYDYREFIRGAFLLRSRRNTKYSLRAYARDLGLSASTLNEILKGRYGLSPQRAQVVAQKLGLSAEEMGYFTALVALSHAKDENKKVEIQKQIETLRSTSFVDMNSDQFSFVSEWHHMALLELLDLAKKPSSLAQMARKLGIDVETVKESLQRMQRLGLIEKVQLAYRPTQDYTAVSSKIPSSAIRHFHRQIIQKADRAIETQSLEKRELSSTVFGIAKKDLPEAKRQLREWRQKFAQNLSQSSEKDDVYCLAIQFFSLLEEEDAI